MTAAMLHAPAQDADTPQQAVSGVTVSTIGEPGSRRCPECLKPVKPSQAAGFRNMFCCPEHRVAFHNRATVRGRVLVPLALAARVTRGGSRRDKGAGKRSRGQAEKLMDQWNREDREAGRMLADEYAALRYQLGHDDKLF